ncbi:class I SAM-dependent methyltransferase [Streptomyces sp. NPDC059009]|uniref:class I SAM-dependent methyltransferase n=1 Tax=Streptomyces sp. NPDC059009 TaxID=3346694 RepID=UPI0036CE669E
MPTIPPERAPLREPPPAQEPHRAREMAESFGTDPARYDRARPRYPDALIERIVAESRGPDRPDSPGSPGSPRLPDRPGLLDVGCGTGIAARQLQAAGARVLGVDVDARMAAFARERGLDVEVAAFETWDAGGRTFDAVVAGQTWHWIDPVAGPARAAGLLRPGGRLTVFWNVFLPAPEVAAAFAEVHQRVLPDAPFNPWARTTADGYAPVLAKVAEGIREGGAGRFGAPEEWRHDWERTYPRDAWLEQLRTGGDASQIPPDRLEVLLAGVGEVIDGMGGAFTMPIRTIALTAVRAAGG